MFYYVLQVATGKEQLFVENAKKLLDDRYPLHTAIYLTRELTVRRQGKYTKETHPLFPSYIFLECPEVIDYNLAHALRQLPDFYHFLKSNTDITPLSPADLAILQHFMQLGTKVGASLVSFDENDRIVVHSGPLKGLEGNIIKVDRRKKRAKIRVDFENSPLTIDLAFDVMEKETTTV